MLKRFLTLLYVYIILFNIKNGMLQKDQNKLISTHDLLKHSFLVENVRQF